VSIEITLSEWLAALEKQSVPSHDAKTICGWAQHLGISNFVATKWVRIGLQNGWMRRVTIEIELLTGGSRRIIGFELVHAEDRRSSAKR